MILNILRYVVQSKEFPDEPEVFERSVNDDDEMERVNPLKAALCRHNVVRRGTKEEEEEEESIESSKEESVFHKFNDDINHITCVDTLPLDVYEDDGEVSADPFPKYHSISNGSRLDGVDITLTETSLNYLLKEAFFSKKASRLGNLHT